MLLQENLQRRRPRSTELEKAAARLSREHVTA